MIPPLQNEIRRCFPYLFEKWGFVFVDQDDDYAGNIVVAQSDTLRIRFIHDRADFFLDIGRVDEPAQWTGFYKIVDQLSARGKMKIEYKYSNKMSAVSRLLDQCFVGIQEVFSKQPHLGYR